MEKVMKSMRIKKSLVEAVAEQAKKENRSWNNMVETLLEEAIQSNQKKSSK